jgi:hypothetical protein
MGVLSRVTDALEANRDDEVVARRGLRLLGLLAEADENKVHVASALRRMFSPTSLGQRVVYQSALGVAVCVSVDSFLLTQVPLMGVLGTAVAALDAHRGLWMVARRGLLFLRVLAVVPENHVRFHAWYSKLAGAFVLAGCLSPLCQNALAGGACGCTNKRSEKCMVL